MKKNRKKGFTLVELLAVIVVLAIILVIAVPKILDVIKSSRENSIISSVKLIARNAEQKLLTNEALGESTNTLNCDEVADINTTDYKSCNIDINNETKEVTVTIEGKGKFSGYTCTGNKNNVTCGDEEPFVCTRGYEYDNYRIREDLTDSEINECVSKMDEFFEIRDYGMGYSFDYEISNIICKNEYPGGLTENEYFDDIDINANNANELMKYIINEYNFSYEYIEDYVDADAIECKKNYLSRNWAVKSGFKEKFDYPGNNSITSITFHKSTSGFDGSGIDVSEAQDGSIKLYFDEATGKVDIVSNEVIYFPKTSEDLFSYFHDLKSIDLNDSINTSMVVRMACMFAGCDSLEEIDLSEFSTINVSNMTNMFSGCSSLKIDISNFELPNLRHDLCSKRAFTEDVLECIGDYCEELQGGCR